MTTATDTQTVSTSAQLTGIITGILPSGYVLDADAPTGGGCRAMIITAPDGSAVYITDGDACLPFSDPNADPEWMGLAFSYYDANNEEDGYATLGDDQGDVDVDNITHLIAAWVEGDPYCDMN